MRVTFCRSMAPGFQNLLVSFLYLLLLTLCTKVSYCFLSRSWRHCMSKSENCPEMVDKESAFLTPNMSPHSTKAEKETSYDIVRRVEMESREVFVSPWCSYNPERRRVLCFCFCWDRVSLCSPGWPQTLDPPKSWDYRYAPSCLSRYIPFHNSVRVKTQGQFK
jgi:hypothetical protein